MASHLVPRVLALLLLGTGLPLQARAADEGRFSYLEQEVRNLQRQVTALTRRLDEISLRPDRPHRSPATGGISPGTAPPATAAGWVDADKWRRIRPGMSELEVVSLLGPPTSLREVDGARVLFYAMEIQGGGFLGGSIRLRERSVAEVQVPTLQ